MGLFNFMETFFFISLGITFVLILLLVYHFKQRMTVIEEKNDTMFQIINNVVKEMGSMKQHLFRISALAAASSISVPDLGISQEPVFVPAPQQTSVTDHYDEDEDEDDEDDYTSDEEDDDDDDDESNPKIVVSDDEDEIELDVITKPNDDFIPISESIEVPHDPVEVPPLELIENIPPLELVDDDVDNEKQEQEQEEQQQQQEQEEQQQQQQEDDLVPIESEAETDVAIDAEPLAKDSNLSEQYKKLSLSALKSLAISKGVTTDMSKMKKQQVIQLLL